MKYVPHSRHACLLLSGLDEIAHKHQVDPSLTEKVKSDTVAHVQALEEDPESAYKNENGKITTLFLQWIKAIDGGDSKKAKLIEQEIDKSVTAHPFPYAETKGFYLYSTSQGYPLEASYDYSLANYNARTSSGIVEGTVSANAKIGIIGDWGTGTEDSFFLLEEMLTRAPDMEAILHLGDIYQSGTPFECIQNFLEPINAIFKKKGLPRIPIFTIPGNHEYFTGAKGYFELLDVLNSKLAPKWTQNRSYFCLRSADNKWQFLGADTGLGCINHPNEPGLEASETLWHTQRLQEFKGKSIFMTHHQFACAEYALNQNATGDLQYFNKRLLKDFETHLDKIDLWIWGHDHWFLPYNSLTIPTGNTPSPTLKRGQLLGGSARETKTSKRNANSIQYAGAVQQDSNGDYILPGSKDGLTNHTYGIFDLSAATVSYYEVGAWEGSTPNETAPSEPLHVDKL